MGRLKSIGHVLFFVLCSFYWFVLPVQAQQPAASYAIEGVADWVVSETPNYTADAPTAQVSNGLFYLLVNTQVRVADVHEVYTHIAVKALNEEGVQSASQLSMDFDPSYQTLTLHFIRVHRDGEYLHRLFREDISILQRETQLEYQIYDGTQTANVILKDVRPGDVVEYGYTVAGSNPVFDGKYADGATVEWSVPVNRFQFRLLWPSARTLYIQNHHTALEPTVERGPGQTIYTWEGHDIPAKIADSELPAWYTSYGWVQLSEWASWADVVAWARELYVPSTDPAIVEQARALTAAEQTIEEKTVAALRWVQDEIRYMGIEMGRGSHEPRAPTQILDQRFGDCKDKVLLLVSLLQHIGVDAVPALVHTDLEHTLDTYWATPYAFNHVIVKVKLKGKTYWFDPTKTYQRGNLDAIYQSDFGRALIIAPGSDQLTVMEPERPDVPSREIQEFLDLRKAEEEGAPYSIQTTYYGASADRMRRMLASTSKDELAKTYLNYYASRYPTIHTEDSMLVDDDDVVNMLVVTENYRITDPWVHDEDEGHRSVTVIPGETRDMLSIPTTSLRTMPFGLGEPVVQKHTITVMLPDGWQIEESQRTIDHDAVALTAAVSFQNDILTLDYTYETRADHVPAEAIADYIETVEAIEEELGQIVYWYDDVEEEAYVWNWPILLLAIFACIGCAYGAVKLYRFDPAHAPLAPEERDTRYQGIGGWLVLVALAVTFAPFTAGIGVWETLEATSLTTWNRLTAPNAASYHPLWAPVLMYELIVNVAFFVGAILMAVLFFQKRQSFPRIYTWYLIGLFVLVLVDTILVAMLPAAGDAAIESGGATFQRGVHAIIWGLYFRVSKRAESTFVQRRTELSQPPEPVEQEAAPHPMAEETST